MPKFINSRRWLSLSYLAICCALLGLLTTWLIPSPLVVANPDISANQDLIRYEGTGGLILPPSFDHSTRTMVASCPGCAWKITPVCIPGSESYCDALVRSCPGLIDHVRTWFRPAGGEWIETGTMCLTGAGVQTVETLGRKISENFAHDIPPQVVRCWPENGAVTQLPILCTSGQPSGELHWRELLTGMKVDLAATPQWFWDFHGVTYSTTSPGGPFPDTSVSHSFDTKGEKRVALTSMWSGSFLVDDLGPFPLNPSLRQTTEIIVHIGEARARLIPVRTP